MFTNQYFSVPIKRGQKQGYPKMTPFLAIFEHLFWSIFALFYAWTAILKIPYATNMSHFGSFLAHFWVIFGPF